MPTPQDIIRQAQPETTKVRLCLDGAAERRWRTARRAAARASQALEATDEDDDRHTEAVEQAATAGERLDEAEQAVRDATIEFEFRALNPREMRALLDVHKPRVDEDGKPDRHDTNAGHNLATFPAALIRESMESPDLSPGDFELLMETVTFGQRNQLESAAGALAMRRSGGDIPFE